MTTFTTDDDLRGLIEDHRRRVADLLDAKSRAENGEPIGTTLSLAAERERATRWALLQHRSADAATAMARLLHLLASALAGQLQFSDEELALLRRSSGEAGDEASEVETHRHEQDNGPA